MNHWSACKNILVIRPDNMGDLLMTTPAIRALKQSFGAKITVLTSSMAAGIARMIPEIDQIIVFDVPWVKTQQAGGEQAVLTVVNELKQHKFDAAVIFTVYSQNPLPTVMLAYLAGIPLRLAYCRENPYQLLTNWVADKEPYDFIKHQVRRDLDLVATIGANTDNEQLSLQVPDLWPQVSLKLQSLGIDIDKPWLVMHPGVSEPKREYPVELWAEAANKVVADLGYQVLLTGSPSEKTLAEKIKSKTHNSIFNVAGEFKLDEFIALIKQTPLLISVNTGTIHIAAATGTPAVVLYALTNPQHTPWMVPSQVLPFAVPLTEQSKNEVIVHVNRYFNEQTIEMPRANDIIVAINHLLNNENLLPDDLIKYVGKSLETK
ncbi:glycosyltransferase family 9 protein [Mucilaginibacter lacusdianchii]|uniref:glycosyltransferase family 9 protein n=1 Tax=Mucilaginibacter lacusdianchii TaxID=2684211 RepID=UPI00131DDACC|nr:glycosyltransferase family 9 protein [Mucilaginibacter sp. JXJ CY 39]